MSSNLYDLTYGYELYKCSMRIIEWMKGPHDRWAVQTQVFAGDLKVKDYWSTTDRQKELITSFRVLLPIVSLGSLDSIPSSWSDHLRWSVSSSRHFLIYSLSLLPCLSVLSLWFSLSDCPSYSQSLLKSACSPWLTSIMHMHALVWVCWSLCSVLWDSVCLA